MSELFYTDPYRSNEHHAPSQMYVFGSRLRAVGVRNMAWIEGANAKEPDASVELGTQVVCANSWGRLRGFSY